MVGVHTFHKTEECKGRMSYMQRHLIFGVHMACKQTMPNRNKTYIEKTKHFCESELQFNFKETKAMEMTESTQLQKGCQHPLSIPQFCLSKE